MATSHEQLPDTHLFNMRYGERRLFIAVGIYAIANILYLILYLLAPSSVAIFDPAIESIAPNIPVIYTPVNWLIEHGNSERAELVKHIYGFNWLFFIFYFPVYVAFSLYQTWGFYERNKNFTFFPTRKLPTYQKALITFLGSNLLLLGFIVWTSSFFFEGEFQFKNLPCLFHNCVHRRNWDLIVLVFLTSCGLILFQVFMYGLAALELLIKDRLRSIMRNGL